jgi:cell division protein FtsN
MKPKPLPDRAKSGGNTLAGVFIGLVLGIVIAAGVVWYINKTPVPFRNRVQPAPIADTDHPPLPLPGKPGDPAPETLPPQIASIPPDAQAARNEESAARNETARAETPEAPGKSLYFQAGSFNQPQEADRLKARLAMMGLEADVQQVMVQDKTFYRLRLGPYTKSKADSVRADLAKDGIQTVPVARE